MTLAAVFVGSRDSWMSASDTVGIVSTVTNLRKGLSMHVDSLSRQTRAVYCELLEGRSEKEIATRIGRSQHTVHAYVKAVYRAAGVRSRAELLAAEIKRRPVGENPVTRAIVARIRVPRSLAHLIEIVDD